MKFDFNQNYKKVSEITKMQKHGELIVDNSYQRRAVWGEKDQVRLIETILLNLVVPSVYFWNSETDPDTGKTITHIVDGQQRLTAITKFVTNNLTLKSAYLLEEESKKLFGNKKFLELDGEVRKDFWDYKLSVIEIAREVTVSDIKNMFKRLNLTDYNLTNQEKRNVLEGEFASLAKELSENEFWENNELFKANVVKRMKDIEFCASLIILYKRGIVDQTTDKVLNEAYTDYAVEYDEASDDREAILAAMEVVNKLINDETISFLKRITQLYTAFSLAFHLLREGINVSEELKLRFKKFVELYGNYKNEENSTLDLNTEERNLYDQIKKYKQASSEGVTKQINRMARFDVLKRFLLVNNYSEDLIVRLNMKLKAE